jgi:hypothetical protein
MDILKILWIDLKIENLRSVNDWQQFGKGDEREKISSEGCHHNYHKK